MAVLVSEKCVACRRDSPPATAADIEELSPQIPDWELISEDGIPKLTRSFRFTNFHEAMDFTAKVCEIAEDDGHHPRIVTEWGRVAVTWWTHKIRNIHRNDFIMAAKTDRLIAG
jgi:4a-hydroxytetrahydrobiopterin dehydratase